MKTDYQENYAAGRPQMYEVHSRLQKAIRIVKLLRSFWGRDKLKNLVVLDVGSSTGIMDNLLAKNFKKVIGIDIDREAVAYARANFKRKNLDFVVGDATKLPFKNKIFDVVVCAHSYEHVPDQEKLFSEIGRVLKTGGVCHLSATNKLWPLEPHYNLLFLSWLPKSIADIYVRLAGRASRYYENPRTYWGLASLTKKFKKVEYTHKILQNPKKFGYEDILPPGNLTALLAWVLAPLARYLSPTFFWLLVKEGK